MILDCGYQPERVQAGIYLLYYTLLASLPLLVGILFIYNKTLLFAENKTKQFGTDYRINKIDANIKHKAMQYHPNSPSLICLNSNNTVTSSFNPQTRY
jgi:hypothetical protein